MKTRATPTVIRHLDTGKEIGLVVSVSSRANFGVEFQVYERLTYDPKVHEEWAKWDTIGSLKSTSGQYPDERPAIAKFDEWVNAVKASRKAAKQELMKKLTQTTDGWLKKNRE